MRQAAVGAVLCRSVICTLHTEWIHVSFVCYSFSLFISCRRTTEAVYTATMGAVDAGTCIAADDAGAAGVSSRLDEVSDDAAVASFTTLASLDACGPPLVLKNFENVFFSHCLCCSGVASMNSRACSFKP